MQFLKTFYLSRNTFIIMGVCILFFCLGLLTNICFLIGKLLLFLLILGILVETVLLYSRKSLLDLQRKLPNRLSNGDENSVVLKLRSFVAFALELTIFEDFPEQLQIRIWSRKTNLSPFSASEVMYVVRPTTRGQYLWRNSYVLAQTALFGLVSRKIVFEQNQLIECFPSFEQFSRLPVLAMVNNYTESNHSQIRKIGQSLEFEQIKEYVSGDDHRHINWKASGKRGHLMLNQYQEERSQDIYCVLDLGRSMKMTFEGQTLLDYAINASLALLKSVLMMKDKAGLLTFSPQSSSFLQAKSDLRQFSKINEQLYNLSSNFLESDYEKLYKMARTQIKQRSLLVIFTNFDSINSLYRNIEYLKALAKYHLILVVFFENTEIIKFVEEPAKNLKEIYSKTIGQTTLSQNKRILKELQRFGIQGLISQPHQLSIQTINQYLRIKKRQMI